MPQDYDHNADGHSHQQNETIDQWTCPFCNKTISSSRPPVYNANNSCCAEFAARTNGYQAQGSPYGGTFKGYDEAPGIYHTAESTNSSNLSVACPEGIENHEPQSIQTPDCFLILGPDEGYNESGHLNSVSFHSNMPPQLEQYILEQQEYYLTMYPDEIAPTIVDGWLPQGVYLQRPSSLKANKSSKRSKPSYESAQSSGGGRSSSASGEDYVYHGLGTWSDDESSPVRGGYPYAMHLSGLTDG